MADECSWFFTLSAKLRISFSKRHIYLCRVLTVASSSTLRALVLDTYSFILPDSTLLFVTLASLSLTSSSHFLSFALKYLYFRELDHCLITCYFVPAAGGVCILFTETPVSTSWALVQCVCFSMGLTSATLNPTLTDLVFTS